MTVCHAGNKTDRCLTTLFPPAAYFNKWHIWEVLPYQHHPVSENNLHSLQSISPSTYPEKKASKHKKMYKVSMCVGVSVLCASHPQPQRIPWATKSAAVLHCVFILADNCDCVRSNAWIQTTAWTAELMKAIHSNWFLLKEAILKLALNG